MTRLIAAMLVIASGVFLFFALTQPIVTSRMVSLNQIIRVVYPMQAFVESKQPKPAADGSAPASPAPDVSPEAYERSLKGFEALFTGMVLKTDAAKKNFEELTKPQGYTAWQSSQVLYNAGDKVSATAIIAFSIVYPVLKTIALMVLILLNVTPKTALKLAEFTHKYTMLDVFVAAVTVVSVSTQKLLVIHTGIAIWWYVGYLVTGFAAVMVLARRRAPAPSEMP
ncbi:MAG: hypothetical protein GC155_03870 [Alphaproteobacteria bacterium]|nr:hypothetical protein [Alphaproteobacteria bacterium]